MTAKPSEDMYVKKLGPIKLFLIYTCLNVLRIRPAVLKNLHKKVKRVVYWKKKKKNIERNDCTLSLTFTSVTAP